MATRRPPPAALHDSPDEVEAQFYEALAAGDLAKMMAVWADDDEIVCVHPGGGRFIGPAAIRASFEVIFSGGGGPNLVPEQVHRLHSLTCAVHHLTERIEADGAQGWIFATNVYVKTAQGWRLAAHHASAAEPQGLDSGADAPSTLH